MKLQSLVAGLLITCSLVASAADTVAHWEYSGAHGPADWGHMQSSFAQCELGKFQSPIDIRNAKKSDLPALHFEYAKTGAEVVNNGHTVQVNLANGGALDLDGVPYKLVQFHFHTPSEEMINGKSFSMVAHLVHQNAEGKLAVVAVLLTEGKDNTALDAVFENLPQSEGAKQSLGADFNAVDMLPVEHGYFRYVGSLTTPPCSEGVRWMVMKQPIEVSKGQIAAFRKLYKENARPVQPLNDRDIEESQ